MAKKIFLVDLDLSQNQLVNPKMHSLATAPGSPVEGQVYFNTGDKILYVYDGTSWVDAMQQDTSSTVALSTGTVTSTTYGIDSNGSSDDVIIASATGSASGVMSSAKFNEVEANNAKVSDVNHNVSTNLSEGTTTNTTVNVNSSDGSNATLAAASTTRAGLLSKAKFDNIIVNNAKVSNIAHPLVESAVPSGAVFTDTETTTSISLSANILTYTDEDGSDTDLDLSLYLDDTNLARLTGGTLNGATGLATFTRDDSSTFTIDMSAFLDAITLNNTLTSTSTTEGLTANMGKTLKGLVDLKAPIASPSFTGNPTAPTPSTGDNDTSVATTAFVKSQNYSTTTGTVKKIQVDCAASTSTTVTHSLGQYVNVNVYKKLTPFNEVTAQITSVNATTAVVTFNVAPTAGEFVIVVQG